MADSITNVNVDDDNSYLGIKTEPFYCSFTVDDIDASDQINVTVYLDGKIIDQTYNATRNFKYSVRINSKLFDELEDNTNHTIEIVASDGATITTLRYIFFGTAIATKRCVFTKATKSQEYTTLDIKFDYILPLLTCKQGDSLVLKFKIEDLGDDIDLTGYNVGFTALKSGGGQYTSTDITRNSDGEVTVYCDSSMTDIVGFGKFYIYITDGSNNRIRTQLVDFLVIKANCE